MRRILIAGATSLIAQETARLFAAEGNAFFLVARNPDRLESVAADLSLRGATQAGGFACDLNEIGMHEEILRRAMESLGGLDTVLIAYGVMGEQAVSQANYAAAEAVLLTNLASPISLLTRIGSHMERQGSGTIAVITAAAGDRGRKSNYVYAASKAGLTVYLQGLRGRLHASGVRVVTLQPGFVDTPMTAHLERTALAASPEAVAGGIYRAIERGRSVVYLPWYWRFIMLGVRLLPEAVFKRMRL